MIILHPCKRKLSSYSLLFNIIVTSTVYCFIYSACVHVKKSSIFSIEIPWGETEVQENKDFKKL